jgi:transposase
MKYRVCLRDHERDALQKQISSGVCKSRENMHARILLAVDEQGLGLTDEAAAERVGVDARTVQRLRRRFAAGGLEVALMRAPQPPRPEKRKLTDEIEARLIALACSEAPEGRCRWTLRLLADKAVELGIVCCGSLSHESVRQALKKTSFSLTEPNGG